MRGIWLDLAWRRAEFSLRVELEAPPEGVTALVGPSGSGKSSLLRLIAGLERPDEGRLGMGEVLWVDRAREVFVPPRRRRVGMVFQDYALFPHRTVRENVGYGLPRRLRRIRVGLWLSRLGLGTLADRFPRQLSGGERQRVALARALAVEPEVLLLDEPFSAVDVRLRQTLRESLAEALAEWAPCSLLVSHDLDDVRYLAHTVGVMVGGVLHCLGPKTAVFDDPGTRPAAEVLGWRNFLPVEAVEGATVIGPWGRVTLAEPPPAKTAWLGIRSECVRVAGAGVAGLSARVVRVTDLGAVREMSCRLPGGLLIHARRPWDEPLPVAGSEVRLHLPVPALRPLHDVAGEVPHRPCRHRGGHRVEGR